MEQPIPVFNPPAVVTVVLPCNPAYLSTAQQKKSSFKTHRVFTNKRVIAYNVQGITGKKTAYTSLPYKRVQAFSIETAGVMDLDSELHLWFSSVGKVRFEFARGVDVKRLSVHIADDML